MPRLKRDRLKLIQSYVRRDPARVPGPSALMIETTVRCNLQCPMCPRTGANYPAQDLPDDILYPLIEDHARLGGDHIYLYGLGEPLLDKRIFTILEACHRAGLDTILSTNATLLTADKRAKLIQSDCKHLLVGIDGASAKTYEYYRKGGIYEQVVENVRALAQENHAASSPLYITVQMIRMKENWHEQKLFNEQWNNVPGISAVRIKDEDIGLPEHRTHEPDGDKRKNPCHILWRGPMVVRYDGTVFPCYPMAENAAPIGNLKEQNLESIWRGAAMTRLREAHANHNYENQPTCQVCPAVRPRLPLVIGAMALRGTTVRKLMTYTEKLASSRPELLRERDNRDVK
ncbi:MAG: radical SAM protein [Deltaproteobacteria bacterium]|jgi:radical SAM protein with 4Fe4S-binding SPASM domain|nr:radical SAM protein [Deltaproteobacteria bacterium]MBT6492441.1 radical SAM protein [Deltaproteobacteria bacterium]